ncbi:PucR family transcriptional regulator [Rhodococcus qingshengii]|uniref:PucR family transcriptional regulator n=1 Tax=Rhodococcus qingshengii TaxID=334542 RepID=UPI0036D8C2BF
MRLLAYNAHVTEVDSVRLASILQRGVSKELVSFIYSCGAGEERELFTVPANEMLGLSVARIGMPVLYRDALLGFVWLLASDGELTDGQAEVVRKTAESAAVILHREHLVDQLARGRERELVRDMLSDDKELRSHAVDQVVEEGLFPPGGAIVVTVVTKLANGEVPGDRDHLAVAVGLDRVRRRLPQNHGLQLDRPDHSLLIVSLSEPAVRKELDSLLQSLQQRVAEESGREARTCWIGVGEPRDSLTDIRASYLEARQAVKVAPIVRVLGQIVHHRSMGVYGLLAELGSDRLRRSVDPGLQHLLSDEDSKSEVLLTTLEIFLDNAGDIKRTADALCVHRGSLYYRIKKIEEITRCNLNDGNDRLALHLGLKVARLLDMW